MFKLRRPSPAFGLALVALFVALGGTGIAAVSAIPSNSVGTPQLRNDSVTRAKIAHQTITSVLIQPGSLLAKDFASGQLPAGPKGDKGDTGAAGPQGERGPQGPAGVMGTMQVEQAGVWVASGGHSGSVTVYIPSGKQATGATAGWANPANAKLGYISIKPLITPAGHVNGYVAVGVNSDDAAHYFTLYVPYG